MMRSRQQQRGIAILTITILIALAAITYFLTLMSPAELKIDRQEQTQLALKQAKQALIAYAVTYTDRSKPGDYGHLPCPDMDGPLNAGHGNPDPSCDFSDSVSIGYFPWKGNGLGVDALRDATGNCLFYAVSPSYKTGPVSSNDMLNEDTNGLIQIVDSTKAPVEGAVASTRPVAVIFATGAALTGQNRSPDSATICGNDYTNFAAYLDNDGNTDNANPVIAADEISQFVKASPGSENTANPLNDQLVTLSREEIWKAILKRKDFQIEINNLTQAIALCLVEYASDNSGRRLPWPAPINVSEYRDNSSYNDVNGGLYAGRLPYAIDDSSTASGAKIPPPLPLAGAAITTLFGPDGTCNSLTVNVQPPGSGTDLVNLNDLSSKYGKLWENWKDHFFYAISKVYEPDSGSTSETQCNSVTNDCITVGGVPYAGIVFYSGSRLSGQSRDAPIIAGDNDDKALISNYLENGNDLIFSDPSVPTMATGTQTDAYNTNGPNPATENDVMWCIKNEPATVPPVPSIPLDVVQC